MQASRRLSGVVGVAFTLAAVALIVLSCYSYLHQRGFLARAEHATGTIVGHVWRNYPRYSDSGYEPVFTFIDRAGVTHRITSNHIEGHTPVFRIGQTLDLIYDPSQPSEVEFAEHFTPWLAAELMAGGGVVWLLVSLYLLNYAFRPSGA